MDEIAGTSISERKFSWGGMVGNEPKMRGARRYRNSWAGVFVRCELVFARFDGIGNYIVTKREALVKGI